MGALRPYPSLFLPNLLRPNLLRPEIHLHCSIHRAGRIVAVLAPTLRISNLKLFYENNRIFPAVENLLRFITAKPLAFYIILRYDVGERRRLQ